MAHLAEQRKEDAKMDVVFPCVLRPVAVFNKKDPVRSLSNPQWNIANCIKIVVGVDVIEGNLQLLTPISAVRTGTNNQKEIVSLGRV